MTSETMTWMAPWSSRSAVRLVMVAEAEKSGDTRLGDPIHQVLQFGRLTEHVRRNGEIFPHRSQNNAVPEREVQWHRAAGRVRTVRYLESLWAMPGAGVDFVVHVADVVLGDGVGDLVAALEDMYYDEVDLGSGRGGPGRKSPGRTHQMVIFSEPAERDIPYDEVQRIIYRADLDALREYSSILRPSELNRRPGRGAALGPFVSMLWGQQDYIENCAFLSVLIGSAASSVIAEARGVLIREIASMSKDFGEDESLNRPDRSMQSVRRRLQAINRVVSNTETRIALCIDGFSTLMPYVPALRVESFHQSFFQALESDRNRAALEQLLGRLSEMVRVEREVIEAQAATRQELRGRRWAVSVGAASVIAIPLGVVFGFFGASASQVDPRESMFSSRYWPLYLAVAVLTLAIGALHWTMYRRHGRSLEP